MGVGAAVLTLRVEGVPEAWARPRPGRNGGFYSPHKRGVWYQSVVWYARASRPSEPLDGPLSLDVEFIFPRPKDLKKSQVLKWTKPDLDNASKAVWDALTEAGWWVDDARVSEATSRKRYVTGTERPGAVIVLRKLETPMKQGG